MKERILLLCVVLTITMFLLGCGSNPNRIITNDGYEITPHDFTSEYMVYDVDTKIVYVSCYTYNGNLVFTPYFSENGLLYRFIDGQMIEVE